jgi:hypothetical protein
MNALEALKKTQELLPEMSWHEMPVSKYSNSRPDQLTRCEFCLKFFELLESKVDAT